MVTRQLNKLEPIVKSVLIKHPESRSDDWILVYYTYMEINLKAVTIKPFHEIMLYHKEFGLPPFESITRARRKIQSNCPELAKEETKIKRLNETKEYINYAIDGYDPTFMKFVDSVN